MGAEHLTPCRGALVCQQRPQPPQLALSIDLHAKRGRAAPLDRRRPCLVDGNKRLGWVSVRLFYRLNDADLRGPADDAFDLVMSIADGTLRDIPTIAERLRG